MILPAPGAGFEWTHTGFGPVLVCTPLALVAPHGFTTRPWTLGATRDAGDEAWAEIAAMFDRAPESLVRMRQVHGAGAIVADPTVPDSRTPPEGDIVVSSDPARVVAVQAADCVPLLIGDRRLGVVAAAHAGWRGLAVGVPRIAIEVLARTYGSRPADLVVAIGPAVGACCYEVGADVRAAFEAGGFRPARIDTWFSNRPTISAVNPPMPGLPASPRSGHAYFDAWTSACDQVRDTGVAADAIHVARLCTASHPDVFCSYRRDGRGAGRIAGAIRAADRS